MPGPTKRSAATRLQNDGFVTNVEVRNSQIDFDSVQLMPHRQPLTTFEEAAATDG